MDGKFLQGAERREELPDFVRKAPDLCGIKNEETVEKMKEADVSHQWVIPDSSRGLEKDLAIHLLNHKGHKRIIDLISIPFGKPETQLKVSLVEGMKVEGRSNDWVLGNFYLEYDCLGRTS